MGYVVTGGFGVDARLSGSINISRYIITAFSQLFASNYFTILELTHAYPYQENCIICALFKVTSLSMFMIFIFLCFTVVKQRLCRNQIIPRRSYHHSV
jgi:hypothetical protein